jgi:hypothetical protein
MKKYWLMLVVVSIISSCSVSNEINQSVSEFNKVTVNKDANYKKSLNFLDSKGIMITEFPPKVFISMPADIMFKPNTAILYPNSMSVIRALAEFISKYQHYSIDVTTSVVAKKQSYISYAIAHNQGEKVIELLTKYGNYRFIGFNTKLIMKDDIFNPYYAAGKYFIDIELSVA